MPTLRVGILGLGRGLAHLRNFLTIEDVRVVAAADRLERRRERAAELVASSGGKDVRLVAEYDELLQLKPDAVIIASNGREQVDHACQAMAEGCAVLSEVPGAYTQEEIIKLRSTVEHTGSFYMLGENSAFADFLRYWRKWMQEERFGPISLAEAEYVHYIPSTLRDPAGRYFRPSTARGRDDVMPTWRADQPPIQYLTHDLGPLLEVLDDRVVSVSCRSGPWFSTEAPLRSDGQMALFETAKGTLIRILITLNTYLPSEHRYRLLGIDGGAEHFSYEGFGRVYDRNHERRAGWQRVEISRQAPGVSEQGGHGGKDLYMARVFTEQLLAGAPSPIDVYRMAEYTLPGIIAAASAEQGGTPMTIPHLRRGPFTGTRFWEAFPQPEADPPTRPYSEKGHYHL